MVCERPEHLPHPKPAAAVATEAGFAVGYRDLQRHACILETGIVRVRTEARQHADAAVADHDLERARTRGERGKARARRLAMAKDVVLEFSERADDLGRDPRRKAGLEGGLVGADRPQLPQIGAFAVSAKPAKRKDASSRVLLGPRHRVAINCGLDGHDKGRFERHGRERFRVALSSPDQLDQRSDQPRAPNANRPEIWQLAIRCRKEQFVGGVEIADHLLPWFVYLSLHGPPCWLRSAPANCHRGRALGPEPPS
ncbi:hypothetical protein AA309_17395 [Microvirga vignae]|uniref:Uncharacterized protein n=1 Tax=Microvirga vignae TaxID=1225564 RepID=A0A0H1RH14_9HYPH|nr:hypothetical protein AA309_17395 [Microvirga vignae]